MSFTRHLEKIALSPQKIEQAALKSTRLVGKGRQAAARDLADEYRISKQTGKPIRKTLQSFDLAFPKMAATGAKIPGLHGGQRALGHPARVTPTTRPGNPVFGLNGLTGAPAQEPFARPIRAFGSLSRR